MKPIILETALQWKKDGDIALYEKPISKLQSVTCRMGSHSVTCHPTEVKASRLNTSQIDRYQVLDLPEGWKAKLT